MRKLSIFSILFLSCGVFSSSWADNPCMPIAKACMQAGYYKGGHSSGKGLVEDCVIPITKNQKPIANATFPADVLSACEAKIAKEMQ